MSKSLSGTTLACGFAGALLLSLPGCERGQDSPRTYSGEPDYYMSGVVEEESVGPLRPGPLGTFAPPAGNGIVRPLTEERLMEGDVAATEHGGTVIRRPEPVEVDLTSFIPVAGNKAEITREDGVLTIKGGPGFLVSEKQYGDFVLQAEVKLNAPDSNSGIFFRTMEPTADAPSDGYEMQLQNTLGPGGRTDPDDYGDGFGTGGIFRRQAARYVNADDGEWFHVTLVAVGNRMATWVNGLQVTDFTDERDPDENPRRGRRDDAGYLVLQGHDPTTDVSFRNLRIQSLDSSSAEDATKDAD